MASMGERGPAPTPSNIRALRGTPTRALPKDEPKPQLKIPKPPDTLTDGAKKYWDEYSKLLLGMRVLSEVDAQGLAMLCEYTAYFWELNAITRKEGVVVKLGPNGATGYNPNWVSMNKAAEAMKKLLAEFGLTPSARARVRTD
jgi:P27 family predicted phage terminase small subunit